MIPDIADIIFVGEKTTEVAVAVDGGGCSGEFYRSGDMTETIYTILAAAMAGI